MSVNLFTARAFTKGLNIDITFRCPLECLRCGRQTSFRNHGKKVPGVDMTIKNFIKIINFFPKISFCGQYSDPVHHPHFIKILEICKEKNITTEVHVASSYRSKEWFIKAFNTNPTATWVFGIDGLPAESHLYRKNQDGQKLFDVMLESKNYLEKSPVWQYIVFSYNEHHIEKAMLIAKTYNLNFITINSSRWISDNDVLKPTIKNNI